MITEHHIILGPVRTRYFEAGSPRTTSVVLIHEGGFGSDAPNTFGRMADSLASTHHVLMPEMLGFGGTDKAVFFGEDPYEPRLRHLASFLAALDVRSAHIVGNSFGGGIVLRMSIHPETAWRMRSATSISGTGGPFRTAEAIKYTSQYDLTLDDARRLDGWVIDPGLSDEEHAVARYESSLRPGQWESMMAGTLRSPAAAAPSPAAPDYPAALSASTVPTLLVAGILDPMFEKGWEDEIASYLSDVRIERPDAGHAPNISQPAMTAELLRGFFDEVDARWPSSPASPHPQLSDHREGPPIHRGERPEPPPAHRPHNGTVTKQ